MQLLIVFAGGGLGSVIRYLIGIWFQKGVTSLTVATFIANLSACFVFAVVIRLSQSRDFMTPDLRLLLLTGFCGGLSTFSAFGYETFLLLRQGMILYGTLNIVFSTAICLGMFFILNKDL